MGLKAGLVTVMIVAFIVEMVGRKESSALLIHFHLLFFNSQDRRIFTCEIILSPARISYDDLRIGSHHHSSVKV